MLGGKHGGLNGFCRLCPVGPSAVLRCCRGVESVEALQSSPAVPASGYSFAQAPGMMVVAAGLLPEGQISRRDKVESKEKDRQVGRCCIGQAQGVVLGG